MNAEAARRRRRFGGREQRAHHVVIVRFGDPQAADLAGARLGAFEIVDQRDAVDLRRLGRHARFPQQIGLAARGPPPAPATSLPTSARLRARAILRWIAIRRRLRF